MEVKERRSSVFTEAVPALNQVGETKFLDQFQYSPRPDAAICYNCHGPIDQPYFMPLTQSEFDNIPHCCPACLQVTVRTENVELALLFYNKYGVQKLLPPRRKLFGDPRMTLAEYHSFEGWNFNEDYTQPVFSLPPLNFAPRCDTTIREMNSEVVQVVNSKVMIHPINNDGQMADSKATALPVKSFDDIMQTE